VEAAGNYHSGDDYVVEFLGYRFSFSSLDFEERVTAAAVRLGLVSSPELDEDETADLVELVHRVKEGLLEVDWDDERQDFSFADTNGGRTLLELLPTPSWHELQYRK
jgi:hypothetical protein